MGSTSARRMLAALVIVIAATAAPAAQAADCNPLSLETCLAPFPSNYWADWDDTSPTGGRANITDDLLRPELLAQLPVEDGISPSGIFNGATGFSAGVGAVFEFTQRQPQVPYDGGDDIVAFDLDSGARVPIHAFVSGHARNPLVVGANQSNVIQVFPQSRWAYTHDIVIALSTRYGAGDPTFLESKAKVAPGSKAEEYVGLLEDGLRDAGIDPATTRTATWFSVRDRKEVIEPTARLMADTAARPHPVRNVRTSWSTTFPSVAAVVKGEVRVDNYRTRGGQGPVDFSGATRKDQWLPFRLTLPRSASRNPAPVMMYAHGLSGSKESDYYVAELNAGVGMATIAIDWPNHGARSVADGGEIFSILRPDKLGTLSGLFNQGTLDLAGLYAAIGGLEVDVLKRPTLSNWQGRGADGRPDIDTSSISMQGTSLGGVLGANFAGRAPKLDVIDFQVAGVGLSHVTSQTVLWNIMGAMFPKGTNGTEEAVLMGALQQETDTADGINTIDFVRTPGPGQSRKPMLLVLGDGDAVVPNPASVAMANLVDLPLVGQERFPMPGVRRAADADPDGYAVKQFPPFIGPMPALPGLGESTAHGAFLWPDALNAQASFIRRFGP
ncbi:hypothetical protein LRS13_06805 [Svornostia abyssi]|uniref:Uncharacterized protein n=1 Tax=Svornostia abyssi TaxID=2898438 RepID=A0ABY5PKR7_9ACTN|nr:hypothetical protein LRS13_06805 [Parviterribacteraceae bacterium J379]